jgi:hypothetical protein
MSAITEFLFPAPARRSAPSIIGWWERRRLPYNLAVGAAGLVSIGVGWMVSALPPGGVVLPMVPWQPVAIFAVMANVCYLMGPAAEIFVDKIWGRQVLPTGPVLYRMGLTFSVGLALFPALLTVIFWVARVVMAVF